MHTIRLITVSFVGPKWSVVLQALDVGAGESEVFIGHDSRDTSVSLASCARKGVECVGGRVNMRGLLTTPQLHWMVREHNLGRPDSEEDYYRTLANAHQSLIDKPGSIPQVSWVSFPALLVNG